MLDNELGLSKPGTAVRTHMHILGVVTHGQASFRRRVDGMFSLRHLLPDL